MALMSKPGVYTFVRPLPQPGLCEGGILQKLGYLSSVTTFPQPLGDQGKVQVKLQDERNDKRNAIWTQKDSNFRGPPIIHRDNK